MFAGLYIPYIPYINLYIDGSLLVSTLSFIRHPFLCPSGDFLCIWPQKRRSSGIRHLVIRYVKHFHRTINLPINCPNSEKVRSISFPIVLNGLDKQRHIKMYSKVRMYLIASMFHYKCPTN